MNDRVVRIALLLAALLAGCARPPAPPPREPAAGPPPGFPQAEYRAAAARGEAVYRIDPARSEILILVQRAGSLARFGHNHTVASRDVAGYVLRRSDGPGAELDLYFPVADLVVDDPDDRARAGEGFEGTLDAEAIQGTYRNMTGPDLLDAAEHPFVTVHGRASEAPPEPRVSLQITIRGRTGTVEARPSVADQGDRIEASGTLSLRHSDLGLEPYSVMGGALRVRDELEIRYRLTAVPVAGTGRARPGAPARAGVVVE